MTRDGAALLSEWLPKIRFVCDVCGLDRRYDRDAMLARLGEQRMTDLLDKLAIANGCARVGASALANDPLCKARYGEVPPARNSRRTPCDV